MRTDQLKIADEASERAHAYVSPTASDPYSIESRYEWGPDTVNGREIFPARVQQGRRMKGSSEFTVDIDPANVGVLLRRTLDYELPNQRANVSVATLRNGELGEFKPAGVWYLAGSNTCLFSNVKQEMAASQHVVQTSNRRFRDDEFLISRALTAGAERVRVRVTFTPVEIPLLPGRALPELGWSEIRYDVYSVLNPGTPIRD